MTGSRAQIQGAFLPSFSALGNARAFATDCEDLLRCVNGLSVTFNRDDLAQPCARLAKSKEDALALDLAVLQTSALLTRWGTSGDRFAGRVALSEFLSNMMLTDTPVSFVWGLMRWRWLDTWTLIDRLTKSNNKIERLNIKATLQERKVLD